MIYLMHDGEFPFGYTCLGDIKDDIAAIEAEVADGDDSCKELLEDLKAIVKNEESKFQQINSN